MCFRCLPCGLTREIPGRDLRFSTGSRLHVFVAKCVSIDLLTTCLNLCPLVSQVKRLPRALCRPGGLISDVLFELGRKLRLCFCLGTGRLFARSWLCVLRRPPPPLMLAHLGPRHTEPSRARTDRH